MRFLLVPSLVSLSLLACATDARDEDGENDDLPSGKADTGGISDGTPEACGVLHLANTASSADLRSHGVAKTAANNIVAHRTYATLSALDAVPYVGPVAFAKLLAYAESRGDVDECQGDGDGSGTSTDECVGSNVPGDFSDLASAVSSFASAGTDGTVCLRAGDFTLPWNVSGFFVEDVGRHHNRIRIVGAGPDKTVLHGTIQTGRGWGTILVQGLRIEPTNGSDALDIEANDQSRIELHDCRFGGTATITQKQSPQLDVVVDRIEMTHGSLILSSDANPMTAAVTNSYFHGAATLTHSQNHAVTEQLVNNTFVGSGPFFDGGTIYVSNNIITGAAAAISRAGATDVRATHNALWNNGVNYNYVGEVTPGTGDITSDCLLDTSSGTPMLRAGSPCIDAADASLAPDHDYLNNARGAHADIGAIEKQ
ncbi:MAG TPA: choice-of-anchor Q domain-containing protein [Kofleriaceae bacterium]|jgi:hypothetical protein